METLWFVIVAAMLAAYLILDGFDLGAGAIYLFAAKTHKERQMILRAIGPVWDGNEVWLLAAGGTLYFAFPPLYASSFSGFYLPLMMVLWLLMLRGIGIEFRTHIDNPVWQGLFDVLFSVASILLAVFFGAALGNVIRGVPLSKEGYFFEALWTNFRVGPNPGILDWYTVLAGVVALVTLTVHGALFIALKTEGALEQSSRMIALTLWPAQVLLTALSLIATAYVSPFVLNNYKHALSALIPIAVAGSLILILYFARKAEHKKAFLSSCAYIAAMLIGAAYGLYPTVLPASTDPAYSLTIFNSAAGRHGLAVGLVWWSLGMVLALGYFIFVYRMFRGKVRLEEEHGY